MTLSELTAAERHRRIAGDFTTQVQQVVDWSAPTPVADWNARDVVDHLVTWLPGLLAGGGVELPANSPLGEDPVATWSFHADAVQALLDDPDRAMATFSHPQVGSMPTCEAIDRFYTPDIFMHTWDLARSNGQVAELDSAFCSNLLAGMEPMEEVIRSSGQYGPRVDVPPDADPQTRLMGFIGRDPAWQPTQDG